MDQKAETKHCYYFYNGFCRFGDNCLYLHQVSDPIKFQEKANLRARQQARARRLLEPQNQENGSYTEENQATEGSESSNQQERHGDRGEGRRQNNGGGHRGGGHRGGGNRGDRGIRNRNKGRRGGGGGRRERADSTLANGLVSEHKTLITFKTFKTTLFPPFALGLI